MNLVNCISNFNVFVFQGTALNPLRLTPRAGRRPQMNSVSHSMWHVIEQLITNPPSYFLQFNWWKVVANYHLSPLKYAFISNLHTAETFIANLHTAKTTWLKWPWHRLEPAILVGVPKRVIFGVDYVIVTLAMGGVTMINLRHVLPAGHG